MAAIDVGSPAIDRGSSIGNPYTLIDKANPANLSGKITSIEIWLNADSAGFTVGTFYTTNGNTLKCRDSEAIGAVASGSKQTISGLDITVEAGDYIGIYFPTAGETIKRDSSGYSGVWYISGEYIDPNDEATYNVLAGDAISLYGIGVEPIEAPTVTTQPISSIGTTTATGNGNITATGGEDASAWGTCLATTANPDTGDTVDAGSGAGGVGAFTTSIDSLTPGTLYHVRAYATNSAGTSYGADVTFTTKAGLSHGYIMG